VIELMTHKAKGEVIDAYTSWEWSTLCNEISKLEVDLQTAKSPSSLSHRSESN
jgi:hypothetical protein